jgi:hypothetical protein
VEKFFYTLGFVIFGFALLRNYGQRKLKLDAGRKRLLELRLKAIETGAYFLIGEDPLPLPSDSTKEERERDAAAIKRKRLQLGLDQDA